MYQPRSLCPLCLHYDLKAQQLVTICICNCIGVIQGFSGLLYHVYTQSFLFAWQAGRKSSNRLVKRFCTYANQLQIYNGDQGFFLGMYLLLKMQDSSDPSVAFTVLVKQEGNESPSGPGESEDMLVNVTHDAVTGAVQDVCSC